MAIIMSFEFKATPKLKVELMVGQRVKEEFVAKVSKQVVIVLAKVDITKVKTAGFTKEGRAISCKMASFTY